MESASVSENLDKLRSRSIDLVKKKLLITKLSGSEQEKDLTLPPNCGGYGRIRHFRRLNQGWIDNPLPIDPACRALSLSREDLVLAQVFQNAVCPWRCWYCFVPYNLLVGDPLLSEWKTADELIDLYLSEKNRPLVIDLSGGSPDLIPEWPLWMMESIKRRGMADSIYLWSDDNLSNFLFFSELTSKERNAVSSYKNYGRVCCLKGYSKESFAFNTRTQDELFNTQFQILHRLIHETEIDLYGYVTFTTNCIENIEIEMKNFVDRLQSISTNFPLRIIPLQISEFSVINSRMDSSKQKSLELQRSVLDAWQKEIEKRFDKSMTIKNVEDVAIR